VHEAHQKTVKASITNEEKLIVVIFVFCSKYIAISSGPQRAKYKQDFNTEYQEYRDLHDNVEKVTRKFAEFESLMRQAQPGTDEFEVSCAEFETLMRQAQPETEESIRQVLLSELVAWLLCSKEKMPLSLSLCFIGFCFYFDVIQDEIRIPLGFKLKGITFCQKFF
jgi:hypothetical protein